MTHLSVGWFCSSECWNCWCFVIGTFLERKTCLLFDLLENHMNINIRMQSSEYFDSVLQSLQHGNFLPVRKSSPPHHKSFQLWHVSQWRCHRVYHYSEGEEWRLAKYLDHCWFLLKIWSRFVTHQNVIGHRWRKYLKPLLLHPIWQGLGDL